MKMYASCPICGHKLCKGENGSEVDILCPRCGKLIRVHISDNEVRALPAERYETTKQAEQFEKTADGKTAQRFSL